MKIANNCIFSFFRFVSGSIHNVNHILRGKCDSFNAKNSVSHHDARSVSSYSKGLFKVHDLVIDNFHANFSIMLPAKLHSKIERKFTKYNSRIIALDGVASCAITSTPNGENSVILTSVIDRRLYENSSLVNLKKGNEINISLLSMNPEKYLLDPFSASTVHFQSAKIAKDHTHTIEFLLECSKDQYDKIKNLKYIGLNGSGFYIQSHYQEAGFYYFTVHAGRNTRENTVFGTTHHPIDTEFTLILPFLL